MEEAESLRGVKVMVLLTLGYQLDPSSSVRLFYPLSGNAEPINFNLLKVY